MSEEGESSQPRTARDFVYHGAAGAAAGKLIYLFIYVWVLNL